MATPSDIHQSSGCLKAREKKKSEISKLEADLSKFDRQTVDPAEYKAYLVQKQRTDKLTSFFLSEGVEVSKLLLQKEQRRQARQQNKEHVRPALQSLLWRLVLQAG